MRKKFSIIFLIVALIVLVGSLAWSGYVLYREYTGLSANAETRFLSLKSQIEQGFKQYGGTKSEAFSRSMKQKLSEYPRLQALIIYSHDTGVEYLISRDASYIVSTGISKGSENPLPQLNYNRFTDQIFRTNLDIPGLQGMAADSVFTILDRTEVFRATRTSLIIVVVLLIVTIILLFLPSGSERETVPAETGETISASTEAHLPAPDTTGADQSAGPASNPAESNKTEAPEEESSLSSNGSLFSPRTGLVWESHLKQRLTLELERAASFDQDMTLALLCTQGGADDLERFRKIISEMLSHFAFQDMTFEYGKEGAAALLPNTDLDEAITRITDFLPTLKPITEVPGRTITLSCGLSSRNGRLISGERLLKEAVAAVDRASETEGNNIIGFRSDPDKYRDFVSKSTEDEEPKEEKAEEETASQA
ncbi:MAG: hypothetical protein K9L68_06395 [Spirochaetales bacterium]|nr:hypothetical protein [Spirochaetales bacterium]MCF7938212.1 hypothetical protein [Spirochaetales bacterium]